MLQQKSWSHWLWRKMDEVVSAAHMPARLPEGVQRPQAHPGEGL